MDQMMTYHVIANEGGGAASIVLKLVTFLPSGSALMKGTRVIPTL
jgi:hypothetical protein